MSVNGSREGKGLVLFCRGDDNKGKELCEEEEGEVTRESGRRETREQKEEFRGRGRSIIQCKTNRVFTTVPPRESYTKSYARSYTPT